MITCLTSDDELSEISILIYNYVMTNSCVCIQDHFNVIHCSALWFRDNRCKRQQRYERRKWWDEKTLAEHSCILSCCCDAPLDRKMWQANNKRPLTYLTSYSLKFATQLSGNFRFKYSRHSSSRQVNCVCCFDSRKNKISYEFTKICCWEDAQISI